MKNKKVIKKPSFIRKFAVWLALLWIITAILFGTLYFVSDKKLHELYGSDYQNTVEDLKSKGRKFSLYHESYISERDRLHIDPEKDPYHEVVPNEYEANQALSELYLAFYEYAREYDIESSLSIKKDTEESTFDLPLYYDDVASVLIYTKRDGDGPESDIILRPAYPLTRLNFVDETGKEVKLPSEGTRENWRAGIKDSYKDTLSSINDLFAVPLWNLFSTTEEIEEYKSKKDRTINIDEVYVFEEDGTFIPKRLYYKGRTYNLSDTTSLTDTYGETYFPGNYTLHPYEFNDPNEWSLKIFKRPEGMKNSSLTDTVTTHWLPEQYSINFSVAPKDTQSLFDVLPDIVIKNGAIWFAVSGLIAALIAYIDYLRARSTYQIFEYRKQLTDSMAHDLKTPLAAVSAYAENLEEDVNPAKRAYYSSAIRENVDSMNKAIEKILDFSKSETGKHKLSKSSIDVRKLIEDEISVTKELFDKKDITVSIEGECVIRSDKELLEQAIGNIIGNAAKYARPGCTYNIVIDKKTLTMSNLTDQKIRDVHELKKPFVKGERSRGSMTGNGLGLAIADNCLASAGHKLELSFENETFTTMINW